MKEPWDLEQLFCGSVTVGERGQVVIPAEARKQCGMEAGDKLLVFRQPHGRGLMLTRVADLEDMARELQRMTARLEQHPTQEPE